jgi:hypothetical protein
MKKFLCFQLLGWYSVCGFPQPLPYMVLDSFSYSEPYSIYNAVNGGKDSFTRGDTALTHNWAEIGASYKKFAVGYLNRYDYDLRFSEDTAEFYHLINNRKPLPEGREYDLSLSVKHYRTEGVRLSYTFDPLKSLRLNVGLSYLKGIALTDGSAQGNATILDQGDYDFRFNVDYYYSQDLLFERKAQEPQGQGYSLDLAFDWGISPKVNFSARAVDLIGQIYWKDAPNTRATASSAVKEYDSNGYLIYQPVLSGYELNNDYTQQLKPQIKALLAYQWNSDFAMLGQAYRFYYDNFYQLGLRYALSSKVDLRTLYMFETDAVSLGLNTKYFNFQLTSDSINVDKAHTFAISINVLTEF